MIISRGAGTGNVQYYLAEIPNSWGWDSKWVQAAQVTRYLRYLNIDLESWFELRVPNPGCIICGSRVGLSKLSEGWKKTCSKECMKSWLSMVSSELWKDSEYVSKVRSGLQAHPISDRSLIIKMLGINRAKHFGHTTSQVYVGVSKVWPVKFGVGIDSIRRLAINELVEVWSSDPLPVDLAYELEYQLSKNIPKLSEYECSEVRDLCQLPDILEFIDKWMEVNLD